MSKRDIEREVWADVRAAIEEIMADEHAVYMDSDQPWWRRERANYARWFLGDLRDNLLPAMERARQKAWRLESRRRWEADAPRRLAEAKERERIEREARISAGKFRSYPPEKLGASS